MKRVKISNNIDGRQFSAEKEDPSAWIAQEVANNSWGKPERWVREGQEDISGAIETRDVIELDKTVKEYRLPAQYTIVIEDMTAELAQKKSKEDAKKLVLDKWKALKKADIKATDIPDLLIELRDLLL